MILKKHADVLEQIFAVEAANGQPLDGVTRCRHTLHFHTAFGTDEKYLSIR